MDNIAIAFVSAVIIPSTTRSATTISAGILGCAAFGACGTDGHRRDFWCVDVGIAQNTNMICEMYLPSASVALTFAGLNALRPPVINVFVADTSAVFIPSAARSTTTNSAGFLEGTALRARHHISNCWGHGWSTD